MCKHEMRKVELLTSSIEECKLCGRTQAELNAVKPIAEKLANFVYSDQNGIQKRSGYSLVGIDYAAKPEGLNSGIALSREFAKDDRFEKLSWDYSQQLINEAYKDAAVYSTGGMFHYITPWSDLNSYQTEINRLYSEISLNQERMAFPKLNYVPYVWDNGTVEAVEEEPINITKSEFMEAVYRAAKKEGNKLVCSADFVDQLWTEIECDWNGEPEDECSFCS